ncbi:hypothetical protein G6F47_004459 [Rhizopus delemar]|uniref:Uncharacterized protein n=1 Tax=Rhizopus delemar TaxID=936053 RepID=A0A9P6Z984_9FUNG|nr:hypothetical protein G6F36_011146 [Rhizopus arrhizus]KAG1515675.1 hypothetical protein G6F53_002735 [Rhizopus delemar]KAG1558553.1 hypothetical protein G6F49_004404 [Rhizopus delemar]KAG1573406.1 hypothetical protein G6F50_002871 [Rhizopus delemar]KAG1600594.1 hypothetical protein G6F47_004459 [Rhizopus delemar]
MRFIHGMLSIDIHAESDIDSVPSSKCFYNGLSCSVFITSDDDDQNEINETEEVEGPEAEPWILENGINITNLFTEYRQRVEQFVKSEGFIPLESHVQELAALNHILIPKPLQYSKMMKEVFTDKHIKHILNEQVRMSIDLSFDFTSEELMQLNLILKHLINQAQSVCKITTDLLLFSSSLNYEKRRAIIDIVLLILKPSRDPIVDVTDISESELWTIYLDPLLSTIVSDNERNTLLRWLKKQAEDNLLRPDASITLIDQLQVGAHLGFGKVKIIQPTCDKAALCSDSFTFNPSNQRMPR